MSVYSTDRRSSRDSDLPSITSSYQQHEIRACHAMAAKTLSLQIVDDALVSKSAPVTGATAQGALGMRRSKSVFSMGSKLSSGSSSSSVESSDSSSDEKEDDPGSRPPRALELDFVADMRRITGRKPFAPDFTCSVIRKVMEPHLRRARLLREGSRMANPHSEVAASIGSSVGVPYTALRRECSFLFDEHTHPLHTLLAQTLRVENLYQVHHVEEHALLSPLLEKEARQAFHSAYDVFVTTLCIPLLHSMALSKRVLQYSDSDCIRYRYQAFPTIQISRPGGSALAAPVCDSVLGHGVGCLTFFIPLTPCEGTSCMFIESHPGKEDWHPLGAKSVGLGYLIDSTRCLHFDLENTTETSRVALTFRVMLHRDDGAGGLCPQALLDDDFSSSGFYDEAFVDSQRTDAVVTKHSRRLLDPSPRLGHPFM